jgi:hypothetical protein
MKIEGIIRCRITVHDFPLEWKMTPAVWEGWIVGKLKEAGVPVKGTLLFRGIKSGTLRSFYDQNDFGTVIYEWTPIASHERHDPQAQR